MKYCVTTYSFSSYINKTKCNYFEICDLVKEMGFDGIEFIDLDKWDKEIDKVKTAKEIKAELERIKRARQALFTPLNKKGEQCYEEVIVLKPEDATGEDRMADAVLIKANGTYQEL